MSIQLKEIISNFEKIIPLSHQDIWDKCGLQCGNKNSSVSRVLFSLDANHDAIRYAIKNKFQLIVTHHPLFMGAKPGVYEKWILEKCKKHGLAVYTSHTNHDVSLLSTSRFYAENLGLKNLKPIVRRSGLKNEMGMGVVGRLSKAISAEEFSRKVKLAFEAPILRFSGESRRKVLTVALCTGSGTSLLPEIIKQKIDYFITGDVKYHYAIDAKRSGVCLADVGHYYSEVRSVHLLQNIFKELFDEMLDLEEYRGLADPFEII